MKLNNLFKTQRSCPPLDFQDTKIAMENYHRMLDGALDYIKEIEEKHGFRCVDFDRKNGTGIWKRLKGAKHETLG